MDTLENNSSLNRMVTEVHHRLDIHRDFKIGELIFLACPTYRVIYFSSCPMTSMDGEDLVQESENAQRQIHMLYSYNEEEKFRSWKTDPLDLRYIKQVVPLTPVSVENIVKRGFIQVPPHFPISLPTYAYLEEPEVFMMGGLLDALHKPDIKK